MQGCKIDIIFLNRIYLLPVVLALLSAQSPAYILKIETVEQKCSEILTVNEVVPADVVNFGSILEMNQWLKANLLERYEREYGGVAFQGRSPEEREREVANRLLRIRLSLLPAESQESIFKINDSSVARFHFPFAVMGVNGFASKDSIGVENHGHFKEGPFTSGILLHEVEHQIQRLIFHQFDHTKWSREQGLHQFIRKVNLRYVKEQGAMFVEWAFYYLLPRGDLPYWQTKLGAAEIPIFKERDWFQRYLDGASLPFDEYLAREHQADRYSLPSIRRQFWEDRDNQVFHPY